MNIFELKNIKFFIKIKEILLNENVKKWRKLESDIVWVNINNRGLVCVIILLIRKKVGKKKKVNIKYVIKYLIDGGL